MASIGVLESHQKETDRPTKRMKRSGGQSLVNGGRGEWIIRNVLLRLFPPGTITVSAKSCERPAVKYIPATLPPAELPALKFEDPITNTERNIGNSVLLRMARELAHRAEA